MRAPFCHACGRIQPPAALDHFRRLNLEPGFDLKTADLERQYFGLQRYLHPDRFAARSSREKALSLQHATALNEAYEVLRQPLRRGEYLLSLCGRTQAGEGGVTIADKALLMEAMERRERLAEAASPAEIEALIRETEAEAQALEGEIGLAFAADDLDTAGQGLLRLRYLVKLAEEARARALRAGAAGG